MTRSSEDNMASVADEVNKMDTDYGKNFKILLPNDQIKGKSAVSTFVATSSEFIASFF